MFEDVHWSDPTTRESLDLLIDRVPRLRVLVIITFRPEFTPPWVGRPHVTMLTLNRLAPRQRAEMIVHVTGGKALPREIAEQIVDRTDGVPLFIEELTKSVVESGLVIEAGDHYAVTGPAAPLGDTNDAARFALARLDRLAPTREVAQIGAALGRSFSHELISAVAQMPQQELDDALEQLVRAELIFRRGSPPDAEYTSNTPGAGRGVRHIAAQPPAAIACAYCSGAGEPISRNVAAPSRRSWRIIVPRGVSPIERWNIA